MKKQIVVALIIAGVFIALLAGVKLWQISQAMAAHASFAIPPEAVTSIEAKVESWPRTFTAIGSLTPTQGVILSAQEPGAVSRILFESGQRVKQGDVLVEQDVTVEDAKLRAAVAIAEQQRLALARSKALRQQNAVSEADLEAAESKSREADAIVESLRASIARRKIVASFSGITGIRKVNVGQYLAPGTEVVPLQALNPLYVNFSLPQQTSGQLKVGNKVQVVVDAFASEIFEGQISAINPQVDMLTRNIEIQATIANPEEKLRAGMFAKATVILPETDDAIAIPASSIQYAPYGDSVYVIEKMKSPEGKEYLGVRQQIVKLGVRRGDRVAVLSGLEPMQQVVTSGVFKLRPGAAVVVNNSVQPGNELQPKPADT